MGFFKDLGKSVLNVAVTPIEAVKDVSTLGGVLTDQSETYTERRIKKAGEKLQDALDDLDD